MMVDVKMKMLGLPNILNVHKGGPKFEMEVLDVQNEPNVCFQLDLCLVLKLQNCWSLAKQKIPTDTGKKETSKQPTTQTSNQADISSLIKSGFQLEHEILPLTISHITLSPCGLTLK